MEQKKYPIESELVIVKNQLRQLNVEDKREERKSNIKFV